ncbi:FMN-dependent NADH-azoreductase [Pontivivens ytuae]|uniref:FMN dependent NADH:quinone oxidoreductase n=1 Tax=Pontivivens ytuae TaxID=2789856 RepID=A0A7S9LT80_9RHOB|nr:NAD(P)H-dependent oxidoreductase [Pontivivens ytuae]QPH54807.1 NAD(P)H-dependent oxidoreductase [Pontivivens ytuae]
MKLLHIDASLRAEGSASRALSAFFLEELRAGGLTLDIDRLDLAEDPPDHFGPVHAAAIYLPVEQHTEEMKTALAASDALATRVLAADALVISTPVYNFGMPSALKAFIDHVSRSGLTFSMTETGIVGHLAGKRIAILASAGGNYRPGAMFDGLDCLTPHLRAIFGFLGAAPDIILAHPTTFEGPEMKAQAIREAEDAARALAQTWCAG